MCMFLISLIIKKEKKQLYILKYLNNLVLGTVNRYNHYFKHSILFNLINFKYIARINLKFRTVRISPWSHTW